LQRLLFPLSLFDLALLLFALLPLSLALFPQFLFALLLVLLLLLLAPLPPCLCGGVADERGRHGREDRQKHGEADPRGTNFRHQPRRPKTAPLIGFV
jgi:hypothetical protein